MTVIAVVICGHVKAHHATPNMMTGVNYPHCRWVGCGCPAFLPPKEAESV